MIVGRLLSDWSKQYGALTQGFRTYRKEQAIPNELLQRLNEVEMKINQDQPT